MKANLLHQINNQNLNKDLQEEKINKKEKENKGVIVKENSLRVLVREDNLRKEKMVIKEERKRNIKDRDLKMRIQKILKKMFLKETTNHKKSLPYH